MNRLKYDYKGCPPEDELKLYKWAGVDDRCIHHIKEFKDFSHLDEMEELTAEEIVGMIQIQMLPILKSGGEIKL